MATAAEMTPAAERSAPRSRAVRPTRLALPLRTPPHPGQFLETRFLKPLGITQTELAEGLGVSRRRVNELIRGHRAITPDTAVRLGIFFRNDATFWMHLQVAWDMRAAARKLGVGT